MNASLVVRPSLLWLWLGPVVVCCTPSAPDAADGARQVVTFPASAVGEEARLLARQVGRFEAGHPAIEVRLRRTPDAADQRHQLYVQWLNAHASDPDVLQLDVIWTAEFAAAGWLSPLERFSPTTEDYFPQVIAAARYRNTLYALPWFVDVGMLYFRKDLLPWPPRSQRELWAQAARARSAFGLREGLVFQGARYEGLVTVFVEFLGAYGGAILDGAGRVRVDQPAAQAALRALRDALEAGAIPRRVLTFHEEETRFAFQNGHALFMRNWPYAAALMQGGDSRVRGRFGVSPLPPARGGAPSAALGGSLLAINKNSDAPRAAYALIAFLTAPEQMRERAKAAGQLPPRRSVFDDPALDAALPLPAAELSAIVARAVPRPTTPVYTELSSLLQIELHRCLSGQASPEEALSRAAAEMRKLLQRVGLSPDAHRGGA